MLTRDNALEIARGSGWLSRQPAQLPGRASVALPSPQLPGEGNDLSRGRSSASGCSASFPALIRVEFAATGGDYKVASVRQPVSWFGQDACFRRGGHLLTMSAAVPVSAFFS